MIRGVRMNIQVVFPVLISFAISVILGPVIIPFLRKLKMGQTERVEGVQSHLKKAGTPTMGGVIFLIAAVVTSLFYVKDYPAIIPVLFLTLGFGIIGFLDDYLKVVLRRSDGSREPWTGTGADVPRIRTIIFRMALSARAQRNGSGRSIIRSFSFARSPWNADMPMR